MSQNLRPVPNRLRRIIILVCLTLFGMIGSTSWVSKAIFAVFLIFVTGTYRRFRVSPDALLQRWTVAYVDLKPKKFKFRKFTRLEVKHEAQTSIGELLMFGGISLLFGWILDTCFPWLGGTYQIWLTVDGNQQELAWQGNSHQHYLENLELLKNASGFEAIVR